MDWVFWGVREGLNPLGKGPEWGDLWLSDGKAGAEGNNKNRSISPSGMTNRKANAVADSSATLRNDKQEGLGACSHYLVK